MEKLILERNVDVRENTGFDSELLSISKIIHADPRRRKILEMFVDYFFGKMNSRECFN